MNSHQRMKQKYLFSFIIACSAWVVGLSQQVSTIVTCPGEDASQSMRISWAAPSHGYYVKYSPVDDSNSVSIVRPETEFRCTTFDGINSKAVDSSDIVENVVMMKCGATLNGLKPDTGYKYVICNAEGVVASEEHYFLTAGAKQWKCCIISDFHAYTPLQHRQDQAMKMIETVIDFGGGIDWTLHLGDIVAWGGSWSFWQKLYSSPIFSRMMWAGCIGNHDYMARGYSRTSNEFFKYANYYPNNGYDDEWGVCYHFRYGNVLFVMLNSESMRSEEGLLKAQQWVERVVSDERGSDNPPRYVVVCEHYQWFFGGNGATSQFERWHKVFEYLGVDLALAGNNHIYVRTDDINGTVYVQTPSADDERGMTMEPQLTHNTDLIKCRWTEGEKTVGAMLMEVDDKSINLTLLDRNANVIDTVKVSAK